MTQPLLTLSPLNLAINTQQGLKLAITDVALSIKPGETYALLGESGCGKSLTALSIAGILPPAIKAVNASRIYLNTLDLLQESEIRMRHIRGRRIAMIFQEPMSALNPVFTIAQQIDEVLQCHFKRLSLRQRQQRVISLLNQVGLPDADTRQHAYPHQLSGGQKQRAMIAMALAGEPELLIADEPTTALDVTIQKQILDLLKSIQQESQMAMLFITHDLAVAKAFADTVGVMYAGEIVEQASSKDFFAQPKHPYTQELFKALPTMGNRSAKLAVISGYVPPLTEAFNQCRFSNRCKKVFAPCLSLQPKLLQHEKASVRCFLYDKTQQQNASSPQATPEIAETYVGAANKKNSKQAIVQVQNLKVYFPIKTGILKRTTSHIKAVDDVSFNLYPGSTIALVGESGCGKTTASKAIIGLLKPTKGSIQHQLNNFNRQCQMIFQDPFSAMNPKLRVVDIIAEGLKAHHLINSEQQKIREASRLLEQVGLDPDTQSRYPHEFSGGQRQRICIARALALKPKVLILDEPTSALDVSVQAQIINLLRDLQQKFNLAYLFISHNMGVVGYLADEILVMQQGKIVEQGEAASVITKPQHAYTQSLMAAVPSL